MKKETGARARMVATATDLFARQGYQATGLNQILEESGAPKGSLYHYFPEGKEELAEAALATARRELLAALDAVFEQSSSFGEALGTVMRFFEARLRDSGYQVGCPAATIALEEAATSDRLQAVCRDLYRDWGARFARALVSAGWPEERARSLGVLTLASVQGALLLARVERDLEPLETVARELDRLLSQSHRPQDDAPASRYT